MIINDHTIEWEREWIIRSDARNEPDDHSVWDARAEDHSKRVETSDYARSFIEGFSPAAGATIFDMGSGAGTLAIPLAQKGHRVICGDFSPEMRKVLTRKAEEADVAERISVRELSWEDDWQAAGIAPKSVDIAVASRSIMVHDLGSALKKLEKVARERVAVTVSTRFGPRSKREVGKILYGVPYLPDFIYALNILFDSGRYPKVSYIDSCKQTESGEKRLVRWAFILWDVT
ncbi:MAG: class I SAM-dependent methyltransferase [Clostridiales Family XIII bacterium]|jgi:SAM-dependent methyltransferase|nr:class I SAM-dependent methyltransferase [Clostridiales Family XIII bacterium]